MINAMYGQGFDYRWANVGGTWVCSVSSDTNEIHKLIDQVKAGPASQPCTEVLNAMKLIPRADSADAFFTLNYVRLMKAMLEFSPMPMTLPEIPTKSSLAMAFRVENGAFALDIAAPKEHVMEMSTMFGMMMQQQMQQMQKQQMKQGPGTMPMKPATPDN
jgi:hypothetical protein